MQPPSDELADTGGPEGLLILAGFAFVIIAGVLLYIARRREGRHL